MRKIWLWLDDFRPAPKGWTLVKTAEEAKKILLEGNVEKASLDHDLGQDRKGKELPNGTSLILWMIEKNIWPEYKPFVHSQNPYGRERMNGLIERYGPYES